MNSEGQIRYLEAGERPLPNEVSLSNKQAQSLSERSQDERKAAFRNIFGGGKKSNDLKRLKRAGRAW